MEAETVVGVSAAGVLVSLWLVWDALLDRRAHRKHQHEKPFKHPIFARLIIDRMLGESLRLTMQLMFLAVGLVFWLERRAFFDAAVWLLVAIPALLAIWSIYTWLRRLQLLHDDDL